MLAQSRRYLFSQFLPSRFEPMPYITIKGGPIVAIVVYLH